MKKIPTVFARDFAGDPRYVTQEVTPGCEWVLAGEGVPTRKWDGTCVMLDPDGGWWARREVKPGKTAPAGFVIEEADELTGKQVGWEPATQSGFAKHLSDATLFRHTRPGTYELVGPKINGNPDHFKNHEVVPHGWAPDEVLTDLETTPRDFDGLAAWLAIRGYEGIVWHHPDGRMAKLKRRDFPQPR